VKNAKGRGYYYFEWANPAEDEFEQDSIHIYRVGNVDLDWWRRALDTFCNEYLPERGIDTCKGGGEGLGSIPMVADADTHEMMTKAQVRRLVRLRKSLERRAEFLRITHMPSGSIWVVAPMWDETTRKYLIDPKGHMKAAK